MNWAERFVSRFERPLAWAAIVALPLSFVLYLYALGVLFRHAPPVMFWATIAANIIAAVGLGVLIDPPSAQKHRQPPSPQGARKLR
jgi:hypothetical protein